MNECKSQSRCSSSFFLIIYMEGYCKSKDIVKSWKLMKNKYEIIKMIVMNSWVMQSQKKDIFLALSKLFVRPILAKIINPLSIESGEVNIDVDCKYGCNCTLEFRLQYQTKDHLALLKKHLQSMDVVVVEVWEH